MVPPFKLYFYPFLLCLSRKEEVRLSDISLFVIKHFNLSPKDLSEKTKQGKISKHISRINYCASYSKRLGLVENKRNGVYNITSKGINILKEKGKSLTRDDLKLLPEYLDMQVNKNNANMVFVKEHYNRVGRFIPGYWCDKKNLSEATLNFLFTQSENVSDIKI